MIDVSPESRLWDLMRGALTARTLGVVAELGGADALGGGPRPADDDWRGDETVVDVGGGNGSNLVGLMRRHPGLCGIVFDLAETVRDEDALREAGCTFVAGSFFESVPAGDVYVLSTILHDWDDESAAAILSTIHAAAQPETRLVLLETVLPPGDEPHGAKWLDLLMLTLFAGRERDEAQWRALLDGAGFE